MSDQPKIHPGLTTRSLRVYSVIAGAAWTAILTTSLILWLIDHSTHVNEIARQVAVAYVNKDLAMQFWIADHGGVYVAVDEDTPPSPWMARLPDRDITTPGGRQLTLMNSPLVLRLMGERLTRMKSGLSRVTSLLPLRAKNAPDPWERDALNQLEAGAGEVVGPGPVDGAPHMRLMRPLHIRPPCLKCHGHQGFKLGDLSGGISVAVPMAHFRQAEADAIRLGLLMHGSFWLFGIGTIAGVERHARKGLKERIRVERELRRAHDYNRAVIGALGQGMYGVDAAGRCTFINPEGERLLGWKASELVGRNIHEVIHYQHADGSYHPADECPLLGVITDGKPYSSFDDVFTRKGGDMFPVSYVSTPLVEEGKVVGAVMTFRDITERKAAEAKIQHMAYHDNLTGLPNRALLMEFLANQMARSMRNGGALAVLFIDLDNFRVVNDSQGHVAGDALLQQVAKRLRETIRDPDILARQGGDEFIVLLTQTGGEASSEQPSNEGITREATQVSDRLLNALKQPFQVMEQEFFVGASIGITIYPQDAKEPIALLMNADSAVYEAKHRGGGCYALFAGELSEAMERQHRLETRLHKAVQQQEFVLHYQPLVDLKSGRMVGVEALIRWQTQGGELVPPAEFIPLAERNGLIIPIGDWALEEACHKASGWREQIHDFYVAVNLSLRQIGQGKLSREAVATIDGCPRPRDLIELEVTEGAVTHDPEKTEDLLNGLKSKGLRLALDDFGTGYSSLSRLKRLPIDTLKIDRSFVSGVPDDPDDRAIVISTIQLAQNLGMRSLAEGIETDAQRQFLLEQGCETGQGYFFGPPIPAEEIDKLLADNRHWTPTS